MNILLMLENERWFIMKSTLIKDTTKEERIALIREWLPDEDGLEADGGMDLWDLAEGKLKN